MYWTAPDGERVEIPAGITVLIMPWTLHRHELYWDKPRAFMPERFLPENRDKINRFQYLPFGAGPRVCIGATFALQEAVIALAVLMNRFRFDMTDETNPWPVQKLTTQPQRRAADAGVGAIELALGLGDLLGSARRFLRRHRRRAGR